MAYFDLITSIQLLPEALETLFVDSGWAVTKYRLVVPVAGDSYRKKFADVRLFKSTGSDGQTRNFGFVHGYGGNPPTPFGEEPVITYNSSLGYLGKGNSVTTTFKFPVYPVVSGSVLIYKDGVLTANNTYTIDYENGTVTFNSAPATGVEITATYSLTDNAPEMPTRLWFFMYEDVLSERYMYRDDMPDYTTLTESGTSGSEYYYTVPTGGNKIKPGALRLYDGNAEVSPADYSVDWDTGTVTVNHSLADPKADYVMLLTKTGNSFGDLDSIDFDPHDASSIMGAVYSSLNFIFPSIPTAMSFMRDGVYSNAWTRDSQIYYWGNANRDRIILYLRVDPAPEPPMTLYAPLYVGRLATIGKEPKQNMVLISGCRLDPDLQYDKLDYIQYTQGIKLGYKNLDYGPNTANGNHDVALLQTIGGAYCQRHYLSFITHDDSIDESLESRFNPSVYTGKYHISPMYVVHPSDGFVGRLDDCYAVHPKNISQLDTLEVDEEAVLEEIGVGDGEENTFHLLHAPTTVEPLHIFLKDGNGPCSEATEGTDFSVNRTDKTIVFNSGKEPDAGVKVLATYRYKQSYVYSLADTPLSPFTYRDTTFPYGSANPGNVSPYVPIGLGIFKDNI